MRSTSASVKRLHRATLALFQIGDVASRDRRRIEQQDAREIPRCGRAPHRSAKARIDELRKIARMIDVRVRKKDGVDVLPPQRECAVFFARLFARPLPHAAIEQDPSTFHRSLHDRIR
jgi:hypothetical protein